MENDLPNTNDPYEILNVTSSDNKKTVKRAYVRLIKIYKPDKFPKEFRKIRKAYDEILEYIKLHPESIDDLNNKILNDFIFENEMTDLEYEEKKRAYEQIIKECDEITRECEEIIKESERELESGENIHTSEEIYKEQHEIDKNAKSFLFPEDLLDDEEWNTPCIIKHEGDFFAEDDSDDFFSDDDKDSFDTLTDQEESSFLKNETELETENNKNSNSLNKEINIDVESNIDNETKDHCVKEKTLNFEVSNIYDKADDNFDEVKNGQILENELDNTDKTKRKKISIWEEIRSQEDSIEAVRSYLYNLIYSKKYEEAISLINDNLFFQDSWKIDELNVIALETCCSVIPYIPKKGKMVAEKYFGNNSALEINVKMMLELHYEFGFFLPLKRFISLSFFSVTDEMKFELYEKLYDNIDRYFSLLIRFEKKNLELLILIADQVKLKSEDELTIVTKKIKDKIYEYIPSEKYFVMLVFNSLRKVFFKTLIFAILIENIGHFFHITFDYNKILIIFFAVIMFFMFRITIFFKRFSCNSWKLSKIALCTFCSTKFIKNKDVESMTMTFFLLEEISSLGKYFCNENFDECLIIDALIYEVSRNEPLNISKFLVFSQLSHPKINDFDFAKQNIEILQKDLLSSPSQFLKEMTYILKNKPIIYDYSLKYINKFSNVGDILDVDLVEENNIEKNFQWVYQILNAGTIFLLIMLLLKSTNSFASVSIPLTALICLSVNNRILYRLVTRVKICKFISMHKVSSNQLNLLFTKNKFLNKQIRQDKVLKMATLII